MLRSSSVVHRATKCKPAEVQRYEVHVKIEFSDFDINITCAFSFPCVKIAFQCLLKEKNFLLVKGATSTFTYI